MMHFTTSPCTRGLALLLPLLITCAVSLQATTYYVSPAGSNTDDGTSLENAWNTVSHGVLTIKAGDTLLIADGIYKDNDVTLADKIGTADRPTVVKAINQWGAKIESSAQFNIILEVRRCEHVVIDGIEVYNPEERPFEDWNSGISVWNSNHVTIQNCYAHDCGCGGINGRESDYLYFRRNVARDNAKTNPYNCSGINVYQPIQKDDAPGPHIIIEDNVAFENECRLDFEPGGFDRPTDGNGIILDDFNWSQNNEDNLPPYVAQTLVQNNLSFNNGGAGAKAFEVANAVFRNNTTAYNNYVIERYGTNLGELAAEFVSGKMEFYNNIAVQTFGQAGQAFNYEAFPGSSLVYRNNLTVGPTRFKGPTEMEGNRSVTHDEQSFIQFRQIVPDSFEFSSVDDFRQFFALRPGSPAVQFGDATLAPATDLTGKERPNSGAVDAGAFEGPTTGIGPLPADRVLNNTIAPPLVPIVVDAVRDPAYINERWTINRPLTAGSIGASDLSANYTAAWDEDKLYLFVEVTDNRLRPNDDTPEDGDGIEVFIDADNSRGDTYDGVNDFHFVTGAGQISTIEERAMNATEGVEVRQRTLFTGYTKEISIPWSTLGVIPVSGTTIGFDIYVNDEDGDGGGLDSRFSWQARGDDADTNPSTFGTISLVAARPFLATPGLASSQNIEVDGERDAAWDTAQEVELNKTFGRMNDGPTDISATWSAVWNPTALYFYVTVTDDDLRNDSEDWWQDDGIEILLDFGDDRGDEELDDNNHQIVMQWGERNTVFDAFGNVGQGLRGSVLDLDGVSGYVAEVMLPWSVLGVTPTVGMQFGVEVLVNDDDSGGNTDHVIGWHATRQTVAQNPSLLGSTFLGALGTTATFAPAEISSLGAFPNPTNGEITLDAPTMAAFDVSVLDIHGRTVQTVNGVRSGERIQLSVMPNGTYFLSTEILGRRFRQAIQLVR